MENRFDFMDFLAYLLPGATSLVPLIMMLCQFLGLTASEFVSVVKDLPAATAAALILPVATALSYILGVLSSSLYPECLEKWIRKNDPLESIHPPDVEPYVRSAFEKIFGPVNTWTSAHFFMSRAAVGEYVPNAATRAYRQASLRQLRRNLIIPVLLWYVASVCLVVKNVANCQTGVLTVGGLTVLLAVLMYSLFVRGVVENRKREVREICCALALLPLKTNK